MMPPRAQSKKPPTSRQSISHQLRALITASGLSAYEVGRRAGLDSGVVRRFLNYERSLTLDSIDQLADALSFRLAATARGKSKPTERRKGRPEGIVEESALTAIEIDAVDPPPNAEPFGPEPVPKEPPQAVASEPDEVTSSDLTADVPIDRPASFNDLADPVAEPFEEVLDEDGPWWER